MVIVPVAEKEGAVNRERDRRTYRNVPDARGIRDI
jgi:hypothetical protein